MLIPMNHVKIFCATAAADMRWGFDRLAQVARDSLKMDPYSGHLYLFFNRSRDIARLIYFDGSGCCVFSKRLEKGTFKVPDPGASHAQILASELSLLLEGVTLPRLKRPKPWQPTPLEPLSP